MIDQVWQEVLFAREQEMTFEGDSQSWYVLVVTLAEFMLLTNYPSRRIIHLRRIVGLSINSVRIMEQNSSEGDASVSANRRINRLGRMIRL